MTDSRLISRLWLWLMESQFETREKDFFLRRGGRRTRGSGGGSGMLLELALVGVLKVDDASLKVFDRWGMRRGVLIGAV